MHMANMQHIPSDILRDVLHRLPADSLWQFRNVCRAWRRIIDDPSFVRSHTINQHSNCSTLLIRNEKGGRLYSLSLESLYLAKDGFQAIEVDPIKQLISRGVPRTYSLPVSACHGLILIPYLNWVIWNPLTRDFLRLPIPDTELLTRGSGYKVLEILSGSLGYDHSTDDYKVVRVDVVERGALCDFNTLVYSLKSGFWRAGKGTGKDITNYDFYSQKGVFLKGALYWRSLRNEVLMFDLGTEDYTKLQGPPLPAREYCSCNHLGVMGGFLVFSCYVDNMRVLEGWIMREINGVWMKLFSFRPGRKYLQPVAYLKEKRVVILQEFMKGLFLLDIDSNTLRGVIINDMPCVSSMQFYPGSLFRLNDHSGAVKRKRKRAHKRLTIEVGCKQILC